MSRILIVEDEPNIRRFLRETLSQHDMQVDEASTLEHAQAKLASTPPDLMLLDLGLPDGDGIDLVRRVREWSALPIIIVSARSQEQDKIAALDAGADDYLIKPFGVGELNARIRAALRRLQQSGSNTTPDLHFGNICANLATRTVTRSGIAVKLTPHEYALFAELVRQPARVHTHRQLLKAVWGGAYVEHNHYLRIYMGQLRHKLETDPARPRYFITETGVGYRFCPDNED